MKSDLAGQAANPKGSRRRRFWSSNEKRRMVAESFAPGASVSKVAQRYGVNANLLFTWRRRDARSAASGGVEAVELLPVRVDDERASPLCRLPFVHGFVPPLFRDTEPEMSGCERNRLRTSHVAPPLSAL
jgi:hypothetical protein